MKKTICIILCLVVSSLALAENKKSMRQMFKDLKTAKEHSQREKIIKEMNTTVPQTEDDIDTLGEELDGNLFMIAQTQIAKTKDPKLAGAVVKVTEKKLEGLKKLTDKDFSAMTQQERQKEINKMMNLATLIDTLGKLKDKQAIPILKKFLDYEGLLSYRASTALGWIGGEDTFNELLERSKKEKEINLSNIKAHRLKKILDELDKPNITQKEKGNLINQIKGSRDPEVNKTLKELALRHKDSDVRERAGLALVNSIIMDPKVGDPDFLVQWANMESRDEDWDKEWIPHAMDKAWDERFIPSLINLLRKSPSFSLRGNAARILGHHKVQEAVPYLEEALMDKESGVRSHAFGALKEITGKEYPPRHPDTIKELEEYYKRYPEERKQSGGTK